MINDNDLNNNNNVNNLKNKKKVYIFPFIKIINIESYKKYNKK